jgi:titin
MAYASWSHPPRADGSRLERSSDARATWVTVVTVTGPDWSAYDEGLTPEQQVCYRVIAFNSAGESPPSAVACTTPLTAPATFVGTGRDTGEIDLAWTDNRPSLTGYSLSRILPYQLDWWPLVSVPADTTAFQDMKEDWWNTDVASYQLTASSDDALSDAAEIHVLLAPVTPMDVAASPTSPTQINLTWMDRSYEAHTIRIERCSGDALSCGDAGFAVIGELLDWAQSHADSGLQAGTAYTYRIRFSNAVGTSPLVTASAITPASTTAKPR